jgi:putative transposase
VLSGQKLPGYRFPLRSLGKLQKLSHRFTLIYPDVEQLLLQHGIRVTRESAPASPTMFIKVRLP